MNTNIQLDFPSKETADVDTVAGEVPLLVPTVPPNISSLRILTARAKHLQSVPRTLKFQQYRFLDLARPIARLNWHDLQAGAWDGPMWATITAIEDRSPHLQGFEQRARIFAKFLRKHAVQLSDGVRSGTYVRTAANARRLIRFINRTYGGTFTLRTLELAHDALLHIERTSTTTSYKICAEHITRSKRWSQGGYVASSRGEPPCSKCAVGTWTDDRDPITRDWQKRADDRIKLGHANKCPWCGASVVAGVWLCKNCGREIQVAPLLLAGDGLEFVYEDGSGRHTVTSTEDSQGIQETIRHKGQRAERVSREQLFLVLDLTFQRWRDLSYTPEGPHERAIQLYAVAIARRFELHVYRRWTAQEVAAYENVLAAKLGHPGNIKRAAISKFVRETDKWVRAVLATFDLLGSPLPPLGAAEVSLLDSPRYTQKPLVEGKSPQH